jgi:hypothetical protein
MFQKQRESTFLRNKVKCPRAQPLGKFLTKPDSVGLYTKKMCTTSVPFHLSTLTISRGNSSISPKRHTICVDQSVSYL